MWPLPILYGGNYISTFLKKLTDGLAFFITDKMGQQKLSFITTLFIN